MEASQTDIYIPGKTIDFLLTRTLDDIKRLAVFLRVSNHHELPHVREEALASYQVFLKAIQQDLGPGRYTATKKDDGWYITPSPPQPSSPSQ